MTQPTLDSLSSKLGDVQQALADLEQRLTALEATQPAKITTDQPHIVRVQGVCGGRTIIEGTRISVQNIVEWAKMGLSPAEILTDYPHLTAEQVAAALAYYQKHPEEIEAEIAAQKRYLEEELPRLRAELNLK